jgi:predicted kinase
MLIIFRGLPGTGKSFLVKGLVKRRNEILVLSRDTLRATIVPCPSFDESEKALIDGVIERAAEFLLSRGRSVIIDGMALSSAAHVGRFVKIAEDAGVPWRIIECRCEERTALQRIAADTACHPAGDRGRGLYFEVKERFEEIPWESLQVDGGKDAPGNLDAIVAYIGD